jgi:hypothetical protein
MFKEARFDRWFNKWYRRGVKALFINSFLPPVHLRPNRLDVGR